jgi:uncharacterized LabA/DUF88 family protein
MTQEERDQLEIKKVKALERIASSIDALTIWFEQIDKDEWGSRIQYYLYEFKKKLDGDNSVTEIKNEKPEE